MEMEMEDIVPEMQNPTTCIQVSKAQAMKIKVGMPIQLTVIGRVKGLSELQMPINNRPNTDQKYHVDIETSEVKGLEDNAADMEYKKLKEEQ